MKLLLKRIIICKDLNLLYIKLLVLSGNQVDKLRGRYLSQDKKIEEFLLHLENKEIESQSEVIVN